MDCREDLYRFIWKIIKDKNSQLIRIGGINDHVHIFINLHPTISLAEMVKTIKGCSSTWMSENQRFPKFRGWAADYYAGSVSPEIKDAVIEYIKTQEEHHCRKSIKDELIELYQLAELTYHDLDMM